MLSAKDRNALFAGSQYFRKGMSYEHTTVKCLPVLNGRMICLPSCSVIRNYEEKHSGAMLRC